MIIWTGSKEEYREYLMSHPGVVVVVVADSGLPQDTQDEKSDDSCVWLQWSRDEMVQMITDDKTAERKRKKEDDENLGVSQNVT